MIDVIEELGGPAAHPGAEPEPFLILEAGADPTLLTAYERLRRAEFVGAQGLFARSDADDFDADPDTCVLVAVGSGGRVLGGVRIHHGSLDHRAIGWWRGSRLVAEPQVGNQRGRVGAALVRAACAKATALGALRFDATIQARHQRFFRLLGWETVASTMLLGSPHLRMRWPVDRFAALATTYKSDISPLIGALLPRDRWRGDDAYPLGGTDIVTSVDSITPSMVEQDPEWAGWCAVLVSAHDIAAMGAAPVGALDALGARDQGHAARIISGIRAGVDAFDLPILGGHTQLGVPAALAMTAFGRTDDPIPASGGRAGDALTVTADLSGGWRPGYGGRQWDSTSAKGREELGAMLGTVAANRPAAAKDVSMAGIVGTIGMLAEASGVGADLDVAAVPRPQRAQMADWLTCFPGYGVISADRPHAAPIRAGGGAVAARCGSLSAEPGVRLHWPDGDVTTALEHSNVTGLGAAYA